MTGPWDDYAEAGPWSDYADTPSVAPGSLAKDPMNMTPEERKRWARERDAFISTEGTAGTRIREAAKNLRRNATPYIRPLLEGGGAVVGGIVGSGAGPGGTLAGAGLGYAMGKNVSDTMAGDYASTPTEATVRTLADIGTGATMEMGGQVVSKGLGYGLTKGAQALSAIKRGGPAVTDAGIKAKAGQVLADNMGDAPIYAQNADEAAKLKIPGYKPSIAEARNDPGLIKLQRGIERQPGTAANTVLEQKAANQSALREYLDKEFTGNESIDDVVTALTAKKQQLEAASKSASAKAASAKNGLNPADTQTTGRGVVDAIEAERVPAKQAVNDQYAALSNDPIPTSNTAGELRALKREFRPGDEEVFPSRAISRVEEALNGKKPSGGHGKPEPQVLDAYGKPLRESVDTTKSEVGFQDLHSLRKDIGRQIQDATSGPNPNRELAMKLQRLKTAIDADIEAGMGADNAYKEARTAFSDYATRFRSGEVAKITQRGNQASGRNLSDGVIAKRVFTPDGADDFIRAVGKDAAAIHADQYAANDLLSRANPITGELDAKTVSSWIQKNATTLNKYGLLKKYGNVAQAQKAAEAARAAESEFTKTAASRFLGADVDKAIESAMSSNPKNTAAVIADLKAQIGNDKQGLKGLQNAFKDFLVSKAETTAKTISGENIISPAAIQKELVKYAPAMRELYGKEPGKIAALQRVSKAVEIQSRSAKSPLGGGSDTAENLNVARSILAKVTDIVPGGNFVVRMGRAGLGALANLNAAEVNKVLARALYDPELAQTLIMAGKKAKPAIVEKRINSHLITLGIVAAKDQMQDK